MEEEIDKQPKIGLAKIDPIRIRLKDNIPVTSKAYPVSVAMKERIRETLEELTKENICKRSKSAYASPAFFGLKKDGTVRTIIDIEL